MIERNEYVYNQINVLIISDRLITYAKELSGYLCSAGIKIIGLVENKEQALKMADQPFDFLIIAGYLKNQQSYEVIDALRKQHKTFIAVHWAMLDALIASYCKRYKISLAFERTRPMSEFVAYLQDHITSCTAPPEEVIITVHDENQQICKRPYTLWEKLKKYFLNR